MSGKEVYVTWIRHGMTAGNQKKRYIGRTDEPLCEEGEAQIRKRKARGEYPPGNRLGILIASPMTRCLQTARLIYPEMDPVVDPGLRECDFGLFENKNYMEMTGFAPYEAWIESNGVLPFPEGETVEGFRERCCQAALKRLRQIWLADVREAVFVVHGGTIMSVMERLATIQREYYQWGLENGCGYRTRLLDPFDGRQRILCPVNLEEERVRQ